jgi:hypothetical protein
VESNTNPTVRNAIQFSTYLQGIETCDVTLDDVNFMTTFYENIRTLDENEELIANPYLVNSLIFDKESLDTLGSKYKELVSAEAKYQYIKLNFSEIQTINPLMLNFINQTIKPSSHLTIVFVFMSLIAVGVILKKKVQA